MKNIVISLYDYTGAAVQPWARAGFECYCFDIQHSNIRPRATKLDASEGGGAEQGSIHYIGADLHARGVLNEIAREYSGETVFGMGFPVCTDMAVSGAPHFKVKKKENPLFMKIAQDHAKWCAILFDELEIPYFIENPVSTLSSGWRAPDYTFNPFEYGEYIPEDQSAHPIWPDYIAPRDAYPKKTCLWTGGGFKMPTKKPVDCPKGYSTQHLKLGGKSVKTKNIRSATPRGFAQAVFEANSPKTTLS